MPGEEAPGLSSVRIQRALRLNGIEDGRLLQSIRLLDCEKQRSVRLIHQDIRLVNLTLDFIHTSSGFSIEGISPYLTIQEHKAELAPCFEYGDRVTSKRFGKFRKHEQSDFRDTQNPVGNQGDSINALRPQSSPNVRRLGNKTGKPSCRLAGSGSGVGVDQHTVAGSGTLRPGVPKSAPPGFSRVGLGTRGKPQSKEDYPQGIRNAIADVGAKKRLQTEISDMLTVIRKDAREGSLPGTPRQRPQTGTRPSTSTRQNVMDIKKAIQTDSEEKLQVRIKEFLSRIPLPKNGAQRT